MGNWHCIPSSCAEVHYREYLPPVVRWRYPDEIEWHEVKADDYQISDNGAKYKTEPAKLYQVRGKAIVSNYVPPEEITNVPRKFVPGQVIEVYLSGYHLGAIYNWVLKVNGVNMNSLLTKTRQHSCNVSSCICEEYTVEQTVFTRTPEGQNVRCKSPDGDGSYNEPVIDSLHDIECVYYSNASQYCRNETTNECTFVVYFDGEIVYQNTRENCPEVEQLPCRLSEENKVIRIEKLPWLERIEVVNYAYQNFGLNVYQAKIPDECLNIYSNTTATIIPLFESIPTPTNTSQAAYGYITQICSESGCPPPEYQIICNCDCQSCPDGTCAVKCNGHICCYDQQGITIKSIPIEDYCEV